MEKKVLFIALLMLMSMQLMAQRVEYRSVANCHRDMQTQDYGKLTTDTATIVRQGKTAVTISGRRYGVVTVDRELRTDSVESIQFTALDSEGKEYVIKFNHDVYNPTKLLQYQVIVFATAEPFDWKYYFCTAPKTKD